MRCVSSWLIDCSNAIGKTSLQHLFLTFYKWNSIKSFQVQWPTLPECFLPESLRGASVMDINVNALDECMEFFHDEGHDAASTSHNFLERSKLFERLFGTEQVHQQDCTSRSNRTKSLLTLLLSRFVCVYPFCLQRLKFQKSSYIVTGNGIRRLDRILWRTLINIMCTQQPYMN